MRRRMAAMQMHGRMRLPFKALISAAASSRPPADVSEASSASLGIADSEDMRRQRPTPLEAAIKGTLHVGSTQRCDDAATMIASDGDGTTAASRHRLLNRSIASIALMRLP